MLFTGSYEHTIDAKNRLAIPSAIRGELDPETDGTRFYVLAIIATIGIGFLWWLITKLDLYARDIKEQILKIRLPADVGYDNLFQAVFVRYLYRFDLISVETVQAGTLTELVYDVQLKKRTTTQELLDELRKLNHNNKVALITGYHTADL